MKKLVVVAVLLALLAPWASPTRAASGGPVVLMGIDAEDGGVGGHGPISVYVSVVNSILSNVSNGGTGILVIGGGRNTFDGPTQFWNAIGADLGVPITYVNGPANIAAQSFSGYAMLAVVSDQLNTPNGLTQAENDALATRQADVAAFVNIGGGLLGFASDFSNPYAYLGGIGSFSSSTGLSYSDITPTPAGAAIGISDDLDICCWHDEYLTFPNFLEVLATNPSSGNAAAIGGVNVFISSIQLDPATAALEVGQSHTVVATVVENNSPVAGVTVNFSVLSGPNAGSGGSATTDANGEASFSYTGGAVGTDTLEASYTDSQGDTQLSNQVSVEWITPPNVDPDCSAAAPSVGTIWPPNHQFVAVEVLGVTDADGDPIAITVSSIYQDEPVDTYGDGRFTPDGRGVGSATAELRAERSGTKKVPGDGRVYHISYSASDGQGGSCSGTVQVGVPHDVKDTPVDGGALYDSTLIAP